MVTITEGAAKILREVQEGSASEQTFRIVGAQGGYQLALDDEHDGDQVVESEGKTVLLVGSDVAESLADVTIDCEEGPEGVRFFLAK